MNPTDHDGSDRSGREPGASAVVTMRPLFLRRRDVAAALAVSESQVVIWERAGLLRPVKLPGIRAIRFHREDVELLAACWRQSSEGAA